MELSNARALSEIRLLATALLSDNEDIRCKIFDFPNFKTEIAKNLREKMINAFIEEPKADYAVYLSKLSLEEQNLFVRLMREAISPTIAENEAVSVMAAISQSDLMSELQEDIMSLATEKSIETEDVRQVLEKYENRGSFNREPLNDYFDTYNERIAIIKTGYPELDRKLGGGIMKGCVAALGARPSVGKTTFAVNMAVNYLRSHTDKTVIFFSLEMSSRMIYDKIVSDVGDIDYGKACKHEVNIDTVKMYLKGFERFIVIDSVYEVERMAEIMQDVKPDLVFVDYVQIIGTRKEFESNRVKIDYISKVLKRTAKRLKCGIWVLSQLTRSAAEEPTMSALKESGGLEQDSDYIVLLKRPFVLEKGNADILPSDTTVKLDKNKFGDTGEIKFDFDGAKQRFTEKGAAHMKTAIDRDEDDLPF